MALRKGKVKTSNLSKGKQRAGNCCHNFNFKTGELEEAEDDECLDVLLKTVIYPRLNDREFVKLRREQAWFEAKKVLGSRDTNLLPEPLDFLEVSNLQDPFAFPRGGSLHSKEPILVFEKVHGQHLARWRSSDKPTLLRVLRVLAEVLELIRVVHEQRFLLNGLNLTALWIDEMDRVHYMATETIVDASKGDSWRIAFPPERYPQGFSPPEAFDHRASLDTRSDLYSWAALLFFLVTGESPAQLAASQGHRYATFLTGQMDRLRAELQRLPTKELARVREWFQIGGKRFVRNWPDSFVGVVEKCLEHRLPARPGSVETMRGWWTAAAPPPIPTVIAFRTPSGTTEILLSTTGTDAGSEMVIRRGVGFQPSSPRDGQPIADGPIRTHVSDNKPLPRRSQVLRGISQPIHYGVFCRIREDDAESYSAPTYAEVLDFHQPDQFRSYAERIAANEAEPQSLLHTTNIPPKLELLEALGDLTPFVAALFASQKPLVRRWAISLVDRQLHRVISADAARDSLWHRRPTGSTSPNTPGWLRFASDCLWQRGLSDGRFDLRIATAQAIFHGETRPPAELLLRVAKTLGGQGVDDQIRAVRSLKACGLEQTSIDAAVKALEADRPVSCPECRTHVRAGDLEGHLRTNHGYVVVEESLLPYGAAVKRLWDQVFDLLDISSAKLLADLFTERQGTITQEAYVAEFQAQFQQRFGKSPLMQNGTEQRNVRLQLAQCLDAHDLSRRACRDLLSNTNSELREIARLVLIPLVARRLADDATELATFRQSVESLCPQDPLEVKLAVCRSLADSGACQIAASGCETDLEQDRTVQCKHCQSQVTIREESRHLRKIHGIYEFRGIRRSWDDTVRHLGDCLFSLEPDFEAAQTFVDILTERGGSDAAIQTLAQTLMTGARPGRPWLSAVNAVAVLPAGPHIAEYLLQIRQSTSGELGMAVFSTCRANPSPSLVEKVVHRLPDPEIPSEARSDALVKLLRSEDHDDIVRWRVLEGFAASIPDNARKLELLRNVEKRAGKCDVIDDICRDVEQNRRIKCPQCNVVLNGLQMAEHVWKEHALILEGRRGRKPWRIAEECIENFLGDPDRRVLDRGLELAALADPHHGRVNFARLGLKRGIDDQGLRQLLEEDAAAQNATICCSCFKLVPDTDSPPIMPVTLGHTGNITSELYSIEETHSAFWTNVTISSTRQRWDGPDPGSCLSKQGAIVVCLLVTVAPLFFIIPLALSMGFPVTGLLAIFGGSALLAVGGIQLLYHPRLLSSLDAAWEVVVDHLLTKNLTLRDLSFIAGLTKSSAGKGVPGRRGSVLRRAISRHRDWVKKGLVPYPYLGLLYRLAMCDHFRDHGRNSAAVDLLSQLVENCIKGEVPLKCLDIASSDGVLLGLLSSAELIMLKYRISKSCYDAGYTVADTMSVGAVSKTVQRVFAADPVTADYAVAKWFAAIQLCGEAAKELDAVTVFDLVSQGKTWAFQLWPDLLAFSRDRSTAACVRGVYFRDTVFRSAPEVTWQPIMHFVQTGWTYQRQDGGPDLRYKTNLPVGHWRVSNYELNVGGHKFSYSYEPADVANRLRRWIDFCFMKISPKSHELLQQGASGRMKTLKADGFVTCHSCEQEMIFRRGQFAIPGRPFEEPTRNH